MKYIIKDKEAGERLDKFLASHGKNQSRSQWQKIIKAGAVQVNHKKTSSHLILQVKDEIEVIDIEIKTPKIIKKKKEEIVSFPIEIVFESKDYLIINKPAGLIVHPTETSTEKTLAEVLIEKYPEIKKVGEDPSRPGIVHRLDREVSGLMVVARNNSFFEILKDQFQTRTVQKAYTALAYGRIINDDDLIRFPIERSTSGYKMSALPITTKGELTERGRIALTEFKVLKRYVNYTLVKVSLKTGRTHQIRVHFCAYGHPLVGDDLYGTHKTKLQNKKINLGRIFLVADELTFFDKAGQKQKYMLDLPVELKEFLNKIK